jgi:hypothetical protein
VERREDDVAVRDEEAVDLSHEALGVERLAVCEASRATRPTVPSPRLVRVLGVEPDFAQDVEELGGGIAAIQLWHVEQRLERLRGVLGRLDGYPRRRPCEDDVVRSHFRLWRRADHEDAVR